MHYSYGHEFIILSKTRINQAVLDSPKMKKYLEKHNSKFVKPVKGKYELLEEQQIQEQGYICTFKEMIVTNFIQCHNLK